MLSPSLPFPIPSEVLVAQPKMLGNTGEGKRKGGLVYVLSAFMLMLVVSQVVCRWPRSPPGNFSPARLLIQWCCLELWVLRIPELQRWWSVGLKIVFYESWGSIWVQ